MLRAWSKPSGRGSLASDVGDEVFGDNLDLKGGFAEYVVAPSRRSPHKPEALTFAQASTIPQAGAIALRGTARWLPGSEC